MLLVREPAAAAADSPQPTVGARPVAIVASRIANSAFHGTRMDEAHLAAVVAECVDSVCAKHGLADRAEFARRAVYVSHETFTPLCANAELQALAAVFGPAALATLWIVATKACHGHLMGAGTEDLVAVELLRTGRLPRVYVPDVDAAFSELRFANGEAHEADFAVHMAAGIGSHIAVCIYHAKAEPCGTCRRAEGEVVSGTACCSTSPPPPA
jgi:3-oxoacyl-(acyl-carrier-protein) synthase